jgi:hypothetical protein
MNTQDSKATRPQIGLTSGRSGVPVTEGELAAHYVGRAYVIHCPPEEEPDLPGYYASSSSIPTGFASRFVTGPISSASSGTRGCI